MTDEKPFTHEDEKQIREWLDRMAKGRGFAGPLPAVGRLLTELDRLRNDLEEITQAYKATAGLEREADRLRGVILTTCDEIVARLGVGVESDWLLSRLLNADSRTEKHV